MEGAKKEAAMVSQSLSQRKRGGTILTLLCQERGKKRTNLFFSASVRGRKGRKGGALTNRRRLKASLRRRRRGRGVTCISALGGKGKGFSGADW